MTRDSVIDDFDELFADFVRDTVSENRFVESLGVKSIQIQRSAALAFVRSLSVVKVVEDLRESVVVCLLHHGESVIAL